MELSQQVCTLEQAKKLKGLGVEQNGVFVYRHWRGNGQIIVDLKKDKYFDHPNGRLKPPYTETLCSAFTVAELGEMFPNGFKTRKNIEKKYQSNSEIPNKWMCSGGCLKESRKAFIQTTKQYDTEAEARAAMLIYLLENRLINLSK